MRPAGKAGQRRDSGWMGAMRVWGLSGLCCCLALGSARSRVTFGSGEAAAFASVPLRERSSLFLGAGESPPFRRGGLHVYTSSAATTLPRTAAMEARGDAAATPVSGRPPQAAAAVTSSSSSAAPAPTVVSPAHAEGEASSSSSSAVAAPPSLRLDPFRPSRASVDPIIINLLVKIWGSTPTLDAERIVNKAIRKRMQQPATSLLREETRTIYRRVYGVEVLRGRLMALLEHIVKTSPLMNRRFGPSAADFGLPFSDKDPMLQVNRAECLLALYMLTEEEGAAVEFLDGDRMEVLTTALQQAGAQQAAFDAIEDPAHRLAAERSLPLWLAQRWLQQYGASAADAIAAKLNQPPPTTLRVNTMRTVREAVVQELTKRGIQAEPTRLSPWGVQVELREDSPRIMDQGVFKLGYVDLINEASQCVTLSTGAKPYDIVLVFGAKKGLKALALASMMRNNGMIYLWEPYERQHAHIAETIRRGQAEDVVELLPNVNAAMRLKADVVLVDALCSNTGALSHHPSMRWSKNETHVVDVLVPRQKDDLASAARAVAPGGVLVYSTCSLLAEENEQVADWFEQEFSHEFEPLSFDKSPSGNRRLLLPNIHGVDGTFIARWKRKAAAEAL